jgi:hypothetical protein
MGALARAAWTGFLAAAREIADKGTFTQVARAIQGVEMGSKFGWCRARIGAPNRVGYRVLLESA